jgi:hypothetical protein
MYRITIVQSILEIHLPTKASLIKLSGNNFYLDKDHREVPAYKFFFLPKDMDECRTILLPMEGHYLEERVGY